MVALIFEVDAPSVEIRYEISLMKEYLSGMESSISHIQDRYLVREAARLTAEGEEDHGYLYIVAEHGLTRFIRQPFVVSIHTLYESSLTRLMEYAQSKEGKHLSHKDLSSTKSFASKVNKYFEHVLGYDFKLTSDEMSKLNTLTAVRNFIAHANGSVQSLTPQKRAELHKLAEHETGLNLDTTDLQIEHKFLEQSFQLVESIVRRLVKYMEARYHVMMGM